MIPISEPWLTDRERELVTDTISRGWISPNGEYVDEFEERFSDFVGSTYAFAVCTGTAALHLSLVAAGIGPEDEVLIPDLTYIACANVVRYVGATPVFVDVDRETYTLDPENIRTRVSDNTAAVMPVHLYGQPCDMDSILDIADEYDLFVIEDAAEAHGALYNGERAGSIGDVGCFSFYGNKILTTGQGGMVTTDDADLAERIRLYRRDGMSPKRKYYHTVVGYNYRLTNVQAAIGVGQVERVEEILDEKHRVAETYHRELTHDDVRFQSSWASGESAHWMVAPVFETEAQRARVERILDEADVEIRPFFHPLHKQPPYDDTEGSYPVATTLARCGLNLPSSPRLDDETIVDICRKIETTL